MAEDRGGAEQPSENKLMILQLTAFALPVSIALGIVYEFVFLSFVNIEIDELPLSISDFTRIAIAKLPIYFCLVMGTMTSGLLRSIMPRRSLATFIVLGAAFFFAAAAQADYAPKLFLFGPLLPFLFLIIWSMEHGNEISSKLHKFRGLSVGVQVYEAAKPVALISLVMLALLLAGAPREAGQAARTRSPYCSELFMPDQSSVCLIRSYDSGHLIKREDRLVFLYRADGLEIVFASVQQGWLKRLFYFVAPA